jgi:hypothetical protein
MRLADGISSLKPGTDPKFEVDKVAKEQDFLLSLLFSPATVT